MTESVTMDSKVEKRAFGAEVGKILHLMIHSLYTNKDIFLRELISNASDACDKLRYLSNSDDNLMSGDSTLRVKISVDKEARQIVVEDNGIGMDNNDLAQNLGTIAHSGTGKFFEHLTGDEKKDSQLIGQFGVGFYSSYMIAEQVKVISRKAGNAQSYTWESDGNGEYSIYATPTEEEVARGTKIILTVKESEESYLDHYRIKHIIKMYSDHISIPIYFVDGIHETQVNSGTALWTKSKSDITTEQYQEFYKSVSYAADQPWITLHNKNEGTVEYTNLLFLPTNKTFDLFHPDRRRRVKLYIKRVFITDENVDLVPHYLRFLRGVVDSEDLPLNISRENLQYNATIDRIRSSITKRVLNELNKKKNDARIEYEQFWNNFGAVLKEGLCEVNADSEKILENCLFYSTMQDKLISLDEYIESLPEKYKKAGDDNIEDDEGQRGMIYYLSGDNMEKLKNSPQIEGFKAQKIDVLLFTDHVDDFWVNVANKYKEYELKSVTRSDIKLDNQTNEQDKKESEDEIDINNKLIAFCKDVLGNSVKDVIISGKLTSSPACLSVDDGDMDIRMERFLIEQNQIAKSSAKILEVNKNHRVVRDVINAVQNNQILDKHRDIVWLLFDQACVLEGEPVQNPHLFSTRLINLI